MPNENNINAVRQTFQPIRTKNLGTFEKEAQKPGDFRKKQENYVINESLIKLVFFLV